MMLVIQRIMVPLLLALAYSSLAGCGVPNAHEAPPAFPWKTGDVIKAEYVNYSYLAGYFEYYFITPEGILVDFSFGEGEDCVEIPKDTPKEFLEHLLERQAMTIELCALEATPGASVHDVLSNSFFGRQMLITFKEGISIKRLEDGTQGYYIAVSRVQLDPDLNAPRDTYVMGNQERVGTIWCPGDHGDKDDDNVYLITAEGARHELVPGSPRNGIDGLCHVDGPIILKGEFLLWTEKRYFRTW